MRLRLLVCATAVALLVGAAGAVAAPGPGKPVEARAWAVLDRADGKVIASRAGARELPIASATKIMTALVALDRLDPGEQVLITGYEALPVESVAGLEAGDSLTVRDLLYALLLASANDAAVELARAASRTVPEFVDLMNRKARKLGLRQTSFSNPIGLDQPGNHSSAEDLARMAASLLESRLGRKIVATRSKVLRSGLEPITVENRNTLLGREPWVNGVKTGQTLGAGSVLVASGQRSGVSLVATVLGAPSEQARDTAALRLLRWGFGRYGERTVVERGEIAAEADIRHASGVLELVAARGLSIRVREGTPVSSRLDAPAEVEGPLRRGDRIGRIVALADGRRRLGSVPLVAARGLEAPTLADRAPPFLAGVLVVIGILVIMSGVAGLRSRRRSPT